MPVEVYVNPRKAEWPEADYVVGNPPFIGKLRIREALGDGYVNALREVYKSEVPNSADFVMYWWHIAAQTSRTNDISRFGLITTNSISQSYNRRVVNNHLSDVKTPLSIRFAIPDHPWIDADDGAAVRIAMTIGESGDDAGTISRITTEVDSDTDAKHVEFKNAFGKIYADLTSGPNLSAAKAMLANASLSTTGVIPLCVNLVPYTGSSN